MPELPEVESVRRALLTIVGARVDRVHVHRRDVIVAPGDRARPRMNTTALTIDPERLLEGRVILVLERRGKQLAIGAALARAEVPHHWITVQLGMTGQLLLVDERGVRPSAHDHVRWSLTLPDGTRSLLIFRDPRRFGRVRAWPDHDTLLDHWSNELGPDALLASTDQLAEHLWTITRAGKRSIKAALLDQRAIAGVGNIYADESLFLAGLRPSRAAGRLSRQECARLAGMLRQVLGRAVLAGGSTLRDYLHPDGRPGSYQLQHAVYGRAGLPCPRCGRTLKSALIAQRTSVWCPHCQK